MRRSPILGKMCSNFFSPATINRNINNYNAEVLSPFHIKDVFAIYISTILRQALNVLLSEALLVLMQVQEEW